MCSGSRSPCNDDPQTTDHETVAVFAGAFRIKYDSMIHDQDPRPGFPENLTRLGWQDYMYTCTVPGVI